MVVATEVCRCGTDRVVSGAVVICPHCDRACRVTPVACPACTRLRLTCTDCRKFHPDEQARARCERSHPAQTT